MAPVSTWPWFIQIAYWYAAFRILYLSGQGCVMVLWRAASTSPDPLQGQAGHADQNPQGVSVCPMNNGDPFP